MSSIAHMYIFYFSKCSLNIFGYFALRAFNYVYFCQNLSLQWLGILSYVEMLESLISTLVYIMTRRFTQSMTARYNYACCICSLWLGVMRCTHRLISDNDLQRLTC